MCGQHTLMTTNLTSGMCRISYSTLHMSKLFVDFRAIEDEETSDTDGEEVEDGTVLPDAKSDDDD